MAQYGADPCFGTGSSCTQNNVPSPSWTTQDQGYGSYQIVTPELKPAPVSPIQHGNTKAVSTCDIPCASEPEKQLPLPNSLNDTTSAPHWSDFTTGTGVKPENSLDDITSAFQQFISHWYDGMTATAVEPEISLDEITSAFQQFISQWSDVMTGTADEPENRLDDITSAFKQSISQWFDVMTATAVEPEISLDDITSAFQQFISQWSDVTLGTAVEPESSLNDITSAHQQFMSQYSADPSFGAGSSCTQNNMFSSSWTTPDQGYESSRIAEPAHVSSTQDTNTEAVSTCSRSYTSDAEMEKRSYASHDIFDRMCTSDLNDDGSPPSSQTPMDDTFHCLTLSDLNRYRRIVYGLPPLPPQQKTL